MARCESWLVVFACALIWCLFLTGVARAEVLRVDNATFVEDASCNPDPDDYQIRQGVGNSSGVFVPDAGLRIPPDAPCATLGKRWTWQELRRRKNSHPDVTSLADTYFAGPDGLYGTADDEGDSYAGHWVWEHIAAESEPTLPPWTLTGGYQVAIPVVPGNPPNNFGVRYGYGSEHGINSLAHRPDTRGNYRSTILVEIDEPWDAIQIAVTRPCGEVDSPRHCPGQFRTTRFRFWDDQYRDIGIQLIRHDIGDPQFETFTFASLTGEQIGSVQVDSPGGQRIQFEHLRVGTTSATASDVIPERELVWSRAEQHPEIDVDGCFGWQSENCVRTGHPDYLFDVFSDPAIHMDRNGNGLHAGGCATVNGVESCHPIYDAAGNQIAEITPMDDLTPIQSNSICTPELLGDLDNDGIVGLGDFNILRAQWGETLP